MTFCSQSTVRQIEGKLSVEEASLLSAALAPLKVYDNIFIVTLQRRRKSCSIHLPAQTQVLQHSSFSADKSLAASTHII